MVRVSAVTKGNRLTGWVEEVDTGKQNRFASEGELVAFLRERFSYTLQNCRRNSPAAPDSGCGV